MGNNANRHVSPAKKDSYGAGVHSQNLTVIIPCAGLGRRMKSYGPKSLLSLYGGTTVLDRQLQHVWDVFPKAEVNLVVGFEAVKIRKHVKEKGYPVRIIYNQEYQNTNVAYSIAFGLQANINQNVLLVYGDLVFNAALMRGISATGSSALLVDNHKQMKEDEVGVVHVGGQATHMAYGLDTKWMQIAFLRKPEQEAFEEIAMQPKARKWFGYEVINQVIDEGGVFEVLEPVNSKVAEIDNYKDLQEIQRNF